MIVKETTIVCIDNIYRSVVNITNQMDLTINKHYTVHYVDEYTQVQSYGENDYYYIENDRGFRSEYNKMYFITLEEHRNSQIDLILDK